MLKPMMKGRAKNNFFDYASEKERHNRRGITRKSIFLYHYYFFFLVAKGFKGNVISVLRQTGMLVWEKKMLV